MSSGIRPNGEPTTAPTAVNPGALAASAVVSTKRGVLFAVRYTNTNVAIRYLQVFDAAAVPADAAVPLISVPVAAGAYFDLTFGVHGRPFAVGCVVCHSSTAAAKTIGGADGLFDASFKAGV